MNQLLHSSFPETNTYAVISFKIDKFSDVDQLEMIMLYSLELPLILFLLVALINNASQNNSRTRDYNFSKVVNILRNKVLFSLVIQLYDVVLMSA